MEVFVEMGVPLCISSILVGFFHYWGSPILGLDKKATNAMLLKVRFGAVGLVSNADVVKKGKPVWGRLGVIG